MEEDRKRIAIFMFYDREGKADEYIFYLLSELKRHLQYLLIVCNGELDSESNGKLHMIGDEVIIRENTGFDVGAYKAGIFHVGFDKLMEYDELLLLNYTFFGPVYPFSEMFQKMDRENLDFWGITKHFEIERDPYGRNPYGCLPEHIQSYFMVLRKSLFSSSEYQAFMKDIRDPETYEDSICEYETIFTRYFQDKGFRWGVYMDEEEYRSSTCTPVMFCMDELLEKQRCPIVKRREFFSDYHDFYLHSSGICSKDVLDIIKNRTQYPVELIWKNILRVNNLADIQKNLQLRYVVSEKNAKQNSSFEICEPDAGDSIWENIEDLGYKTRKGWILVNGLKIIEPCSEQYNRISIEKDIRRNLFAIEKFDLSVQDSELGMLIPGTWIGLDCRTVWKKNAGRIRILLAEMGLSVDFSESKCPYIPMHYCFGMKSEALVRIRKYSEMLKKISNEEFICILPLLLQAEGYYTAEIMDDRYAAVHITNQEHKLELLEDERKQLEKKIISLRDKLEEQDRQRQEQEFLMEGQRQTIVNLTERLDRPGREFLKCVLPEKIKRIIRKQRREY